MATNSNSDQGNIDNNELEVIEVNESARDMMSKLGIDIAYATFFAEKELALENLKYESVVGKGQANNNASASDANSSGNAGGGSTVNFVDAKATEHKMSDIIENPAMEIPEGELDSKKKEQIKAKAEKSAQEKEARDAEDQVK